MSKPRVRLQADGKMLMVNDGLTNYVANLGTERDKAAHSFYSQAFYSPAQLIAAYKSSAIARKIVDMPARDSFRSWRNWNADKDQISALEATEKRLNAQRKLLSTYTRARLYGGAALYIGTKDRDLSKPLVPGSIGKDGLQYLTVLSRWQIQAAEIDTDPSSATYRRPAHYTMRHADGTTIDIHPSRFVIFNGEEDVDDFSASASEGWGDSVLEAALPYVVNMDASLANVNSLIFEAKVDVLGIPELMNNFMNGGEEYERVLLKRARMAATAKGINGMLLKDAEETYDQKSASFATLPDILDKNMQLCSAAAGVPVTLLFGISPGGLNATGEADIRGYYDHIKANQELELQPEMEILDECLIVSSLGSRPPEVHYNWRPLWQPSAKELAEIGDLNVKALSALLTMNVLPEEVISKTAVNTLTESGAFPGLESSLEEWMTDNPNEEVVPEQEENEELPPANPGREQT